MSKSRAKTPEGRPITDEKGNRTWQWRSDAQIDTATVRTLGEGLSFEVPGESPEGCNPYDRSAASEPGGALKKRRTLDDMRRLSEKIKRNKKLTGDE